MESSVLQLKQEIKANEEEHNTPLGLHNRALRCYFGMPKSDQLFSSHGMGKRNGRVWFSQKKVYFYSLVPSFKRGDTMKTIPPANIG